MSPSQIPGVAKLAVILWYSTFLLDVQKDVELLWQKDNAYIMEHK